jgi:hypothetical protein
MNDEILCVIEKSLKDQLPKWEITVKNNSYQLMNKDISIYSERINFTLTIVLEPEYYTNNGVITITQNIIDQLKFYINNLLF